MCGFVAEVDLLELKKTDKQLDDCNLSHRGPDGKFHFWTDKLNIFFYRLAIRSIESGDQPFAPNHGDFVSVFNGELYNEEEIRNLLSIRFPEEALPHGDMQLLGHLIWKLGPEAISNVDGMFAGFIHLFRDNQTFLFRDRVGEKPIFYLVEDKKITISSEARLTQYSKNLNIDSLNFRRDSLRGFSSDDDQMFTHLKILPPGSWMSFQENQLPTIRQYWKWPQRQRHKNNIEDIFESELDNAIQSRLVSDVPICTLLSGGIDSSLVTLKAKEFLNSDLTAFTLKFPNSKYDETANAALIAKHLKINHEVVTVETDELVNLVPEVLNSMDIPILDSACISQYVISREISKNFKVALSGDGGDELLMGYQLFKNIKTINTIKKLNLSRFFAVAINKSLKMALSDENSYISPKTKLLRALEVFNFPSMETEMVALSPFAGTRVFSHLASNIRVNSKSNKLSGLLSLEEYYRQDILPKVYLTKSDRMSMANGLELRSPFFSPRLIEVASSIDASEVMKGIGKYPLRKIAEKYLPKEVLNSKKHGFSFPFHKLKFKIDEPNWKISAIGIPEEMATEIWNSKNENSGNASWALIVLNHFMEKSVDL